MAISKFDNGNANGHDKILAKLSAVEGKELKFINGLISNLREEEIMPHEWKYGIIGSNS
jgi:hypothetical protein